VRRCKDGGRDNLKLKMKNEKLGESWAACAGWRCDGDGELVLKEAQRGNGLMTEADGKWRIEDAGAWPTASENEGAGLVITFTWGCARRTRFTPSYHIAGLQPWAWNGTPGGCRAYNMK
jgi:hypothetical protein